MQGKTTDSILYGIAKARNAAEPSHLSEAELRSDLTHSLSFLEEVL